MIAETDVSYTFSGGANNSRSDSSLGGLESLHHIVGGHIFNDITEAQAKTGRTDYRCIYLNNVSTTETLYGASLLVAYTVPGDVSVAIGLGIQNERQNLTVSDWPSITSGTLGLNYSDAATTYSISVPWASSTADFAASFQSALRLVPYLQDVVVTSLGTEAAFEIAFFGASARRSHQLISVAPNGNGFVPSGHAISVTKTIDGGPINSTADFVDVETTPPGNIIFADSAVFIGDLRPLDAVPIWLQRAAPANSSPLENDGFTLRLQGNPTP